MSSFQENAESYRRLQIVLGQLLQGQKSNFIIPHDQALLVLETSSDSVGFTVVNGNSETVYKSAYTTFKQLYREKHAVWNERNLSFVVCRSKQTTSEDAFLSLIEMDIYFCRKYVVRLPADDKRLERELLRLPFLPMMEGKKGGVVRPPSAQTLLQNLGVSASLSRQIIVPGERSASRIVKDVTTKSDQLPDIGGMVVPSVLQELKPTEHTRIKSIVIEAFRAYKKKQGFDVDADIVVLYGPNGLGKTSFFDAIDYVCTGRIGRLCHRNMTQEEFINLARHLSTSNGVGSVTMEISQGTSIFQVKRKVDDWSSAYIGDDKLNRAKVLQLITSAKWGEKKERIENLERLFRATHLFSQTVPELLIEFEKHSTLSADLVSRTLALDDYASGNKKLQEILDILEGQIIKGNNQLDHLKFQLKDVQDRIKELPSSHKSLQAGQQLKKMAAELLMKLRTDARVTVEDTAVTVDSVREWRAVIEAELKNVRERLFKLQKLESGFAQFEKNKKSQKEKLKKLTNLDVDLQKYDGERKRLEDGKKKLLGELNQSKTVLSKTKANLDSFAELKGLQDIAQEIQTSLQQWNQELKRVEKETAEAATKLQQLLPSMEQLETRKNEVHEALDVKSQRIQTLTKIQDGLVTWEITKKEVRELQQFITSTQSYVHKNRGSFSEQQRLMEARVGELEEREQQYKKFTSNQAELTRILDEIELHVKDGVCPTCGVHHKNKEKLIESIRAQKETRPIHLEELAERCRKLRKSLEEIKASIALLNREQKLKKKELEELSEKLVAKQKSVTEYEQLFEQFDLSLDDRELPKIVSSLLTEETATFQEYKNNLVKIKKDEDDIARKIKELQKKQLQEVEARKRANDAIEPLEQQMRVLRSRAEVLDLPLDMSLSELTAEQKNWTARKAEAEKHVTALTSQEESLINAFTKAEALSNEMRASAEIVKKEKEALEREVLLYEEMATYVIKRDAFELGHIIEQRKQTSERVEVLERLTLQALTLERALDSAQRSAMLSELDAKAQAMLMQEQEIEKEIRRISTVKKWFSQISDILNKHNSDAVGNHVLAFGPLTTLLQKRLRDVYGFGDVNLHPVANEIRVVVDWEGKNVKPTDYFSDSQKQILMLSLFMSGRLTQTWSGFAPILLDDPVTHFDDLNAFGFVELIRGLVSASPGKRQFFISTCEERLFELMRQKFGKTARFYRFEGITADGPFIKKLEH